MLINVVKALFVAASIVSVASTSFAQEFPTKPVRIILPFAAGTGPDVIMRLIADKLSHVWQRPVVIDARPGSGGILAMQVARQAAADGHALAMVGDAVLTINQHLHKTLPYDVADFAPIMRLYQTPFYLMVSTTGPYRTLPDLLAAAKAAPNKLSFGSTNVGSPGHLAGALLMSLTGTQLVHVPFRDAQQLFISLANGDLAFVFASPQTAAAHIEADRVKPIAVGMRTRTSAFPNIPTVKETGGPDMEYVAWTALITPRGTPNKVIAKINADVRTTLADSVVADRIRLLGNQIAPSSPQELADMIRIQSISNGELVRAVGFAPQ